MLFRQKKVLPDTFGDRLGPLEERYHNQQPASPWPSLPETVT